MSKEIEQIEKKHLIYIFVSLAFFILLFFIALFVGRFSSTFTNFIKALFTSNPKYNSERIIILYSRLPRTIIASLTGISLSISGLIYQEVFQNKLTSPNLLGVSNGAAVGAAAGIILALA